MEEKKRLLCLEYFKNRYYGICSHFDAGFYRVTAYTILDLLKFITNTEPAFLFSSEIKELSENVGFQLPESEIKVNDWAKSYFHIDRIYEDIELKFLRDKGKVK